MLYVCHITKNQNRQVNFNLRNIASIRKSLIVLQNGLRSQQKIRTVLILDIDWEFTVR